MNFFKFSSMTSDRYEDIVRRILFAFGIDWTNDDAKIDFDLYVKLKCFLVFYTIEGSELYQLWTRIINPGNASHISYDEFFDFLERLCRGSTQDSPTLVSRSFAVQVIELLKLEGCVDEKNAIIMVSLNQKLKDGSLDIELFN